jgi:hypothetical protein
MKGVSTRRLLLAGALLVILSAQVVSAEPRDRSHGLGSRIKHFIVTILDQLGGPPG